MGTQYTIVKRADGWVIAVDGREILTCNRRHVAVQIVQQIDRSTEDAGAPNAVADTSIDTETERLRACS